MKFTFDPFAYIVIGNASSRRNNYEIVIMQISPEIKRASCILPLDERNTKCKAAAGNFLPYYYQRASIENRKCPRHLGIGKSLIPIQHGAIIHASQNRRHFFFTFTASRSFAQRTWTRGLSSRCIARAHACTACMPVYNHRCNTAVSGVLRSFRRPLTNPVVSSLRVLIMCYLSTSDIINCT